MADLLTVGTISATALTALGGTLDYLVGPDEKQKIRDWLEPRLYKFSYVTRRNFGCKEIKAAISTFERFAGARFLSIRRWICALTIIASTAIFSALTKSNTFSSFAHALAVLFQSWNPVDGIIEVLIYSVSIAASFSLTLFLSRVAIRVRGGTTLFGIVCLLLVHLALPFVWLPFVKAIQFFASFGMRTIVEGDHGWRFIILISWSRIDEGIGFVLEALKGKYSISDFISDFCDLYCGGDLLFAVLTLGPNFLRPAFTAWFLVMLVYLKVFRPLIIRFLSALIRPEAALFTPPLFGLGSLILLIDQFPAVLSVLAAFGHSVGRTLN
jgi:hypothetical protein